MQSSVDEWERLDRLALDNIKSFFKGHRYAKVRFELIFFAVSLAVALLAVSPLFRHPGMPRNHEDLNFEATTAVYAEHFKHGDLFPIWSTSYGYGLGTPLPLYYHKVFYYLSGLLYLVGGQGTMKAVMVVTLIILMLVGIYGIRKCLELLQSDMPRYFLLFAPQTLVLSNYAFTDWLVRGAAAEFSAFMIVPWLIWWSLLLVVKNKVSYAIVPILFLLVNAHNVTAMYGVFLPVLAYGIFLRSRGKEGFVATYKKLALCVMTFVILLLPMAILQLLFYRDYNPANITQMHLLASQNFQSWTHYFVDTSFVWLKALAPYTVQIDYGISVVLLGGLVVVVLRKTGVVRRKLLVIPKKQVPPLGLLIGGLVFYFALQLSPMKFLYQLISPMQVIQFPWRLLVYITSLGILVSVFVLLQLRVSPTVRRLLFCVWILSFVVFSPLWHTFNLPFFSPSKVNSMGRLVDHTGLYYQVDGIGEYLPRMKTPEGKTLQGIQVLGFYNSLWKYHDKLDTEKSKCTVQELPQSSFETSARYFSYDCTTPHEIKLPVSFNRLSIITNTTTGAYMQPIRQQTEPRMVLNLPAGKGVIEVRLPSLDTAFEKLSHHL